MLLRNLKRKGNGIGNNEKCNKNSPSKVREAQNKIELDYIGKQYSTEMEIHEKYGKRHMLKLTAIKEAHILKRKAFIIRYGKDPFIL
jgi:hypothetical protein